jgi:flagellar biosynthesis/type III secretory pathway protein FliH
VAVLFRLEKSQTPAIIEQGVSALIEWLQHPQQDSLRRAFTLWIRRVMLPAHMNDQDLSEIKDLLEIKTMLAETVIDWTKDWKQQGIEEGRVEGFKNGECTLLERQMIKRFGPIDPATRERLHSASPEQLERWAERILDAQSLADVFDAD